MLGAQIAPKLPTFPTIYLKVMSARFSNKVLFYHMYVFEEDVTQDS